jgi:hypothetical protein
LICKILPDQGSFPMLTASKAFIAFCLLAVGGTVLVIGPTELRRLLPMGAKTDIAAKPEPKVEPKPEEPKLAAVAPPAPAASPAPAPEPKAGALAETQKQVTAALADLAPVKPPPAVADSGPRFDVARVDDHGEAAVIAGQATPGAKVELLRDGKPIDAVEEDASGQFVMTTPQLPAGGCRRRCTGGNRRQPGDLPRRQPVGAQPARLWRRRPLCRDLQRKPRQDPQSQFDLSWPDLRAAAEGGVKAALRRGSCGHPSRRPPAAGPQDEG